MIRFLRKIRQDLVTKNKISKYLLYAVGEILLVVIGILIALQVDSWNEERRIDGIRKNYYEQLLVDLKNESKNIENRIDRLDSSIESFNNYLEFNKTSNLELEEVVRELGKVDFSIGYLSFNTNTIQTLESTGDIRLIPTGIRNELLELKRIQDGMILTGNGNQAAYLNIQQEGYKLGTIRMVMIEGHQQTLDEQIIDNLPASILTIESAYALKNYTEKERLEYLKRMLNNVKSLKELINLELEK